MQVLSRTNIDLIYSIIIESEEFSAQLTEQKPFRPEKPILLGQQESSVELTNLFYDILNQ